MRKINLMFVALMGLPFVLGISSCEEKIDGAYGIHVTTNPDGTKSVTVDPSGGPIGSGVKVATDAASSAPGPWTLVGYAIATLFGAGGLVQTVLKNRTQNSLNATVAGVSSFTVANPTQAPALLAHIDAAHDAAQVPGHIQDAIQGQVSPT